MKLRNSLLAFIYLLFNLFSTNFSYAEPLIVLEFSSQSQFSEGDGNNLFSVDPDHSEEYIVKTGDSLNSILKQFYKGSGLDWRFVQLAIVIANPKAFAKNNPNFLFSDKTLYLPGRVDIAKLLVGKKIRNSSHQEDNRSFGQNIYFFGG